MWVVFTLLASALWAINNFVDKHITNRLVPDMPPYLLFSALGSLLLALGVISFNGLWIPPLKPLLIVAGGGALFPVMIWFYLKALKIDEASYVVPLFQFSPIWSAGLAFYFLQETFGGSDAVAFIIILLGGLVLCLKQFNRSLLQLRPAFWLMLAATFFVSAMFISFKYVLIQFPEVFWSLYAWQMIGQTLGSFVLALLVWQPGTWLKFKTSLRPVFPLFFVNDGISFMAFVFYLSALMLAPVAFVGAVSSVQGFFVFLLGLILTKTYPHLVEESVTPSVIAQKLIGIAILLGGVALLQLG